MTIRNKTLFFEIADIMEFEPETYRQNTWGTFVPDDGERERFQHEFGYSTDDGEDYNWVKVEGCGTARCIAGHAAALTGWFPTVGAPWEGHPMVSWISVSKEPHQSYTNGTDITTVASSELGITDGEASTLFAGGAEWTPDEVRGFGVGNRIGYNECDSDEN